MELYKRESSMPRKKEPEQLPAKLPYPKKSGFLEFINTGISFKEFTLSAIPILLPIILYNYALAQPYEGKD